MSTASLSKLFDDFLTLTNGLENGVFIKRWTGVVLPIYVMLSVEF
jgi:hypothetical protein